LASWGEPLVGRSLEPRRATHARFLDAAGKPLDDGIALYFKGPRSFTGEDVIELQGHGGLAVNRMVLERAVDLGARIAEPGEFTRRAFLNGRLDLAQAEAVADLIEASTAAAARCAMRSLAGEFSERIREVTTALVELRMLVEATLDFPEEALDPADLAEMRDRLGSLARKVEEIRVAGRRGIVLRSGLRLVLVGRPNVGKSSVLNALSGEDLAIVSPIPGTTRDALRERIEIGGVPVHVVDTAGVRDSDDPVENLGIVRTWGEVDRADAVLLLTDARDGIAGEDEAILQRLPSGIPVVTVCNKSDLVGAMPRREMGARGPVVTMSALTGAGLPLLRKALLEITGRDEAVEDTYMARERHLDALDRCGRALLAAASLGDQFELLAEELRGAHMALGEIVGEFTADDLLGEIFSRFCIGK